MAMVQNSSAFSTSDSELDEIVVQQKGKKTKWKKSGKKCKVEKFMEDEAVIHACYVQPWELNYFMNTQYHIVDPEYSIQESSVEEILEETFRFIYPDEIPELFCKYTLKDSACWKDIVPKMYYDILQCKTAPFQWLCDNFGVDYTKKDFKLKAMSQNTNLEFGQDSDNVIISGAAKLALRMNRLFQQLNGHQSLTNIKPDSSEIREKVKGVIYAMFSLMQISVMLNGECKVSFDYDFFLSDDVGNSLILKAKPDAVLFTSSEDTRYPYCAVQVYGGPYNDKVDDKIRIPNNKSSTTDSNVTISISDEMTATEKQIPDTDPEIKLNPYISSKFHMELTENIKLKVPDMFKSDSAFEKVAGQLPLEMFGLSMLAEKRKVNIQCQDGNNRLKMKKNCVTLGLFIANELVHVVKFTYKQCLLFPKVKPKNSPDVIYANWCFNLKKANDRIAFLAFLYYYDQVIDSELRST